MKNFLKILFLFFVFIFGSLTAQKADFYDDIQHFKKLDAEKTPPKDAILFLGSSSFTMWKDVADYFPDKTIINRAFGGSRLLNLNYYAEDLLNPYQPKQVVIYCGENDIAHGEKPSAKEVFKRFKQFYKAVRAHYPNANIAYVSIKYSPSREQYWPTMKQVNNGNVRKDIYLEDMLHMKPEGYKIWTKVMYPYLK